MNLTIHINDKEVVALLNRAHAKLADLSPMMHEIGQRYERRVLENFAGEQAPDGTPWQRLSATTMMLGGSSPRARGTVPRGRHYRRQIRFIPADAGNGPLRALAWATRAVFIPAGVGNGLPAARTPGATAVHPRGRGERGEDTINDLIGYGSSPRARGTVQDDCCQSSLWRFIPAGAENG